MILIPYGPGFLQLTEDEYETAMARGLAAGPSAVPAPPDSASCEERWLTSAELSTLTKIGDTTLEGWAAQGRIPCIRAGKALRFKLSEVEATLRHADKLAAPPIKASLNHRKDSHLHGPKSDNNQETTIVKGARS